MKRKKTIIAAIVAVAAITATLFILWQMYGATTRVALVNLQAFQSSPIVKSNTNPRVKYEVMGIDEFSTGKGYDMVIISGMGLKINDERRNELQEYADKGHPILVYMATNPANAICSLDSIAEQRVTDYLVNGNRKNFVSLANYIRKHIDGKSYSAPEALDPVPSESEVFYHLDEEVAIKDISEYEKYLSSIGQYQENAPRVAIVGTISDPFSGNKGNIDSLIVTLQRKGFNVYPILSGSGKIEFLDAVRPNAIIYQAHGRLMGGKGDEMVEALKRYDAPLFIPLTLMSSRAKWEQDAMGMYGGFMSQSLVMPELDGAIYPYVLNTQEENADGIVETVADPVRLSRFAEIVTNMVALQTKPNKDKKVAIYYFKGPGQTGLAAQGLETVPSLYNLLKRMKEEGYTINLPSSAKELEQMIMKHGAVLSDFTKGAIDDFMHNAAPIEIDAREYDEWLRRRLTPEKYNELISKYGEAPGEYMAGTREGHPYISIAAVPLGNVILLPQPMSAIGDDSFAIIHGANTAPPHPYVAAYLWAGEKWHADAMLHFGTHGSLEFTPQKQVALGESDWPDALVGTVPHFYYYTIGNIGESMMAKRRSYATVVSYLTPPFEESKMRSSFSELQRSIVSYEKAEASDLKHKYALEIKKQVIKMGLHRELRLDSLIATPYGEEEILKIANYAEEISSEKIYTSLYITGEPYTPAKIRSTIHAMTSDPIGYSKAALDRMRGKLSEAEFAKQSLLRERYLQPAQQLVAEILDGRRVVDSLFICSYAGVSMDELREAVELTAPKKGGMQAMMQAMMNGELRAASSQMKSRGRKGGGGHPSWIPKIGKRPESTKTAHSHKEAQGKGSSTATHNPHAAPSITPEKKAHADAIMEVARTLQNVMRYRDALLQSPERELAGVITALRGGYIAPSSGGDAVANPQAIPTGRNLYSINAEVTPTEVAWENGKRLAQSTLDAYVKKHGEYPKKVSYTFWSSEFIESGGVTIAQVLYMLGVEPVRDMMGRVSDVRLIPSEELGRPRVDVLVQTSGQFRDLAASRLNLISKAVSLAAAAGSSEPHHNYVHDGNVNIEKRLVEEGLSPKDAREWAGVRVFGGVNGMYGTGIQEMIKAGDKWDDRQEIAEVYLNNMGAAYATTDNWGAVAKGLFRAAVENTDMIVQPRQSNTWGALSLDHVFEFMGGLNLTITQVTGKEPEALFADYRNRNNVRMQDLKEAVGVESRSTLLNPHFVKEVIKGGNSSAMRIAEIVENTYGWEVSKPEVIDDELWDAIFDTWVDDVQGLGTQAFFESQSPAALEQITSVMIETVRKGMWQASPERLQKLVEVHDKIVQDFGASGASFAVSNAKLRDFIAQRLTPDRAQAYTKRMAAPLEKQSISDDKGIVLSEDKAATQALNGAKAASDTPTTLYIAVGVGLVALLVLAILGLRKRNKNWEE